MLRVAEKGGGRGGRGTARDACSRFPYRRGTVVCAFMKICQTHPRDPFVPLPIPAPPRSLRPILSRAARWSHLPPRRPCPSADGYREPRVMIARDGKRNCKSPPPFFVSLFLIRDSTECRECKMCCRETIKGKKLQKKCQMFEIFASNVQPASIQCVVLIEKLAKTLMSYLEDFCSQFSE